nr:hypothetical protein [Lysinibacillus timonensis]
MIQLSINLLIKIILILLAFCLLLIIYLISYSVLEKRRFLNKKKYIKKTKNDWYRYLLGDGSFNKVLIPKNNTEIEAVEEILISYIKGLSNDFIQVKIDQFNKYYLHSHYRRNLKSRSKSKRLKALNKIFDFRISELVIECEKMEKYRLSKEEKFQILKIKSVLQKDEFFEKFIFYRNIFTEFEYKQIFVNLNEEVLVQLLLKIDWLKENAQYALLETIAIKRDLSFMEGLENLLDSDNLEIRLRVLKSLEKIGVVNKLERFIPFVFSTFWEERLMVTKLFSHVPLDHTYKYLKILLEDSNWNVRVQAANTIVMDQSGIERLREFIITSTDQYAIDMAKEVLIRRLDEYEYH